MRDFRHGRSTRRACLVAFLSAIGSAEVEAQWSRVYDTYYLPAQHNWAFRNTYPGADRLFNAFDYGHAILYEKLWTMPDRAQAELEQRQYDYLTKTLLVRPPRLPLEEMAIEPNYGRVVPEAKAMFEWAHILHRQAYDILGSDKLTESERDREMRAVLAHYRRRPDLRFSERPKNMSLMQEQPYSLAFREQFPKFNGLIWSYHWLQVGLYEPLLVARSPADKQRMVGQTVARFKQMLDGAPDHMPFVMPMTPAIAPTFAARFPEFAIIFDNLHSLHDVISDILANPSVPRGRKRAEILLAASRYRDDTTAVMTVAGWRAMAQMMGLENQGGPAVDFAAALPTPTVARGAVMRHDSDGNMIGDEHAKHARPTATPVADEHAGHNMPAAAPSATTDSLAVVGVVDGFHSALAAEDSTTALGFLEEGAQILESGARQTKAEYRNGHLGGDIRFAATVTRVRGPIQVEIVGDVAWATSTSTTTANAGGTTSVGAELMVLRKRAGAWRIAAVHWSSRRGA